MQDPFKGFNDNDDNDNGNGPQGLPLPPNYATVVNSETGTLRIAKVGFSWTMLVFPPWPTIFRADWYNLLCILGVNIATQMLVNILYGGNQAGYAYASSGLQLFLSVLWGAIYNLMYFRHLFNHGFVPADERSRDLLTRARYWRPKA